MKQTIEFFCLEQKEFCLFCLSILYLVVEDRTGKLAKVYTLCLFR